jgi:non-ribosomal peptide synthetase component F
MMQGDKNQLKRQEIAQKIAKLPPQKRGALLKFLEQEGLNLPILPIVSINRQTNTPPLSYTQERLWFLTQLEENSSNYNIPAAVHVDGVLDVNALQQAIDELVCRHEILRTTFTTVDGTAVQKIALALHIPLQVIEVLNLEELTLSDWLTQEAKRSFDLETGPLLRVTLLHLSEATSVLAVSMHHIISDGWSIGIFIRELAILYGAYLQGQVPPLLPLPIQYADYTLWQRQWMQGEILDTQLSYWRQQLDNIPALLELPTDHSRPTVQSFRGQIHTAKLPLVLSEKLQTFSQRQEVTLFMLLLAAFQLLLLRYSGQQDIVVGTPIANRQQIELEALIGCFVNTLVLRVQIGNSDTVGDLLQKVKRTALSAYEHQDLPFEQIVEALQPERSLAHSPLFQVMFVLQNESIVLPELPNIILTSLQVETTSAKFDLTLSMEETSQGLIGYWEYMRFY